MSKQVIDVGEFSIGIPQEKMFDVAVLKIDLRPALSCLKNLSQTKVVNKPSIEKTKVNPLKCKKGCNKVFVSAKNRRTHERKYHNYTLSTQEER